MSIKFLTLLLSLSLTAAAGEIALSFPDYRLNFRDGEALISSAAGEPLVKIGKASFRWAPPEASPARAELTAPGTVRVSYRIDKAPAGQVALEARFTATPAGVKVDWGLAAPKRLKVGGAMLAVAPQAGVAKAAKAYKSGVWKRRPGGVPTEERDGYYRAYAGATATAWQLLGGNHNFTGAAEEHLGFHAPDAEPTVTVTPDAMARDGAAAPRAKDAATGDALTRYQASTYFLVTPPGASGAVAAARRTGRPVTVELTSNHPYNLWESEAPEMLLTLASAAARPLGAVRLQARAWDYDGNEVFAGSWAPALAPGQEFRQPLRLPATERGIYFLEAAATIEGQEIFTRAQAAVLPPHHFAARKDSPLGISAYFPEPTADDCLRLLRRLGVHWLRDGDNRATAPFGLESLAHSNVAPNAVDDPLELAAKLRKFLATYAKRDNQRWEFCNEWNMPTAKEKKREAAARYAKAVAILRRTMATSGRTMAITSMGLAGADGYFLRQLHAAGAWPQLDSIALHPGRGNSVPDCTDGGWTYLGAIRETRRVVATLGDKPLDLTEVYACTHPNDWWKDSLRQAVDNTVLTLALGMAEGARTILFYQLNDGTWHDVGGVNHRDAEYHYGLLCRDLSPKPSLLAFAAAAENLDGAVFQRYFSLPGTAVKGMEFSTPRGAMAILYDRSEGYYLARKESYVGDAEAWQEYWRSRVTVTAAAAAPVRVIDAIGRPRRPLAPAADGRVSLTLDGSPLFVYGLDLDTLRLAGSPATAESPAAATSPPPRRSILK